MSLGIALHLRHCCAVAVTLAVAGPEARAADSSLPEAVTSAFETIVIDATKAASKATAAAKEALAAESRKSKRGGTTEKKAGKASDKKDADETDAAKAGRQPAGEAGQQPGKADPAAKAADGAEPADPKADADAKRPAVATEWPAAEVELARARCTRLLKDVDAVTIPEPPFRQGECGSMAPVRLVSIGKDPEVALSPPPVVSCDLVVALTKWIKEEVQPSAKRHLGSEVIRMESMSDYSCRMAYGRVGNKLSEHGKANALDIRGFTTRKGEQAVVLTHWGETRRDVLRRLVAARAAAEKAAADKAAAEKAAKQQAEAAASGRVTALPRKTIAEGLAKDGKTSLAVPASVTREGDLESRPSNLGGPKEAVARSDGKGKDAKGKDAKKDRKDRARQASGRRLSREEAALLAALPPEEAAKVGAPGPKTATSRFLHEVHASGCRIFGTTLGPEANEAHRNHFHVDMAERKVRKICD